MWRKGEEDRKIEEEGVQLRKLKREEQVSIILSHWPLYCFAAEMFVRNSV